MDLTRAEFRNCNFINCEFLQSDLSANDFWDCQFVETTFKHSNLDLILVGFTTVFGIFGVTLLNFNSQTYSKPLIRANSTY